MSSLCSNNIPSLTNGLSRIYDQCYCLRLMLLLRKETFFKSSFTEETFLLRQICFDQICNPSFNIQRINNVQSTEFAMYVVALDFFFLFN